MAFCGKCGARIAADVHFCPACGANVTGKPVPKIDEFRMGFIEIPTVDPADAERNKIMAILAYILFFIPLLKGEYKISPFLKFHTNQGTVLALSFIAYNIVYYTLSFIIPSMEPKTIVSAVLLTIIDICRLAFLAPFIIGIKNAATGNVEPLPVTGRITIIK